MVFLRYKFMTQETIKSYMEKEQKNKIEEIIFIDAAMA